MKSLYKKLLCLALALLMLVSAIPAAAAPADGARDSYPDVKFPICEQTDLGDVYGIRYADPRSYQEMTINPIFRDKPTTVLMSGCLYCSSEYVDLEAWGGGGFYRYSPSTFTVPPSINTVEDNLVGGGKEVTLIFEGDAPSFGDNAFAGGASISVKYPSSFGICPASGWENVVGQNFGGETVSWTTYRRQHEYVHTGTCMYCGDACEHKFAKGVWVTQPTCTEDGQKSYTCRICDYVKYARFPATGHSFVDGVCSGCGFEAPDHDYVDGICIDCGKSLPEDVQPCATHNFNRCVCTFCGTLCPSFDLHLEGGDHKCSVCGYWDWSYTVFDECLHVNRFGTWITKPTCTDDGEVRLDCNYCTDAQTVTVPAHGHEFVDGICIYCDLPDSASCEHSYDNGVVVRESTCAVKGEKLYTCTLCGATKTEALKLANHYYIDKLCVNCARPAREDMDCGSYHNFRDCNCMVCGYTCTDHVYDNDTCQICGFSKNISSGDECSHQSYTGSWITKATCTTNGQVQYTCLGCDHSYTENVPAPGHELVDGVCIYCDAEVGCVHSYENGVCTVCGEACKHDFARGVWVTQPTCTEDGRKSYTCQACGYVKYARFPATGHSIENGVCTVCGEACEHNYEDSTCTICGAVCDHSAGFDISAIAGHLCGESGSRRHTCKVCDYSYDQSYATLTHQYEDGICIFCGSEKNDRYEYVVLDDGTCRITRCLRVDDNMTVPDYLDGYLVTEIGMEAFIWASMDVMQLPAGIRSVAASAFSGSTLSELILTGDAPQMNSAALDAGVTVKYPARNETYTQELFDSLSHVTWEPYCADHSFVDGKCEYCGEACVHSLEETVPGYSPTCTGDGLTDGTICAVCGKTLVEQEPIPTQGHNYYMGSCSLCGKACSHEIGDMVWIIEPTCTEDGECYTVCLICELPLYFQPFPRGHSFTNGICENCGEADPNWTGPIGSTLSGEMLLPCENVQVQLYLGDELIGTATVTGSRYHFDGLDTGEFTLKVSCDGGVPREYAVTVEAGDNTLDVALSRPGDVNGDRQMNIIDVAMLYGSIKGTATLDDYATACGDINHDGQVNIIDVAMAYAQVKG